jgi:hypothetical protein
MTPYLIGLHMTIDSWRPGRDSEGWRKKSEIMVKLGDEQEWAELNSELAQPAWVLAVPRLKEDVGALQELTKGKTPPLQRVRCSKHASAYYGFGDALGCGFGATVQFGNSIEYEYGK